jgi:hypothetical protein
MNWYRTAQGLPGDPSLPPGVTNNMINEQFGGPDEDISSKQGETEVAITIKYSYGYDYNSNEATDIKVLAVQDSMTQKPIQWPELSTLLGEYFDREIRADIEINEEDAKIERQPGYNPMEQDRIEEF